MRTTYVLGVLSAASLSLVWACSSSSSPTGNLGGGDGGSLPDTSVDDGSGDDGAGDASEEVSHDSGPDAGGSDGAGDASSDAGNDVAADALRPLQFQCPMG